MRTTTDRIEHTTFQKSTKTIATRVGSFTAIETPASHSMRRLGIFCNTNHNTDCAILFSMRKCLGEIVYDDVKCCCGNMLEIVDEIPMIGYTQTYKTQLTIYSVSHLGE
jgi:hypothetical protein